MIIENDIIPIPKKDINWEHVIGLAENMKNEIISGTFHEDNDYSHYFFEITLLAIYGDDFFDWYNKNT